MSKSATRTVTLAGPIIHRGQPCKAGDKVTLREDQIKRLEALQLIKPEASRKTPEKEET